MYTPVFIDDLPDVSSVSNRKSELYRLTRARALADLLLDDSADWQERACPGCGQDRSQSGNFSQAMVPFHRCSHCNTIYAARVPDQARLDALRARLLAEAGNTETSAAAGSRREFEFVSILNWIRLTEARTARNAEGLLPHVLDYRFCSESPAWPGAVDRLGQNRDWTFLPLDAKAAAGSGRGCLRRRGCLWGCGRRLGNTDHSTTSTAGFLARQFVIHVKRLVTIRALKRDRHQFHQG